MNFIETDKIELKEKYNDTVLKDIEAFLNTEGGTLYIGVNKEGIVTGVTNIDETLRKIADAISEQIEPRPLECVKPVVEIYDAKALICIYVSKGFASLYCLKKYGYSSNGCHLRVGSTTKSMNLEMIKERVNQNLITNDLLLRRPSYFDDLKFLKLKMLLLEKGLHINEANFEKNFKLRTSDGRFNYLAELLADVNSIPFIFVRFKGATRAALSERSDYGHRCFVLAYENMLERLKLENICKTITNPRPRRDIYLFDIDAVNEALVNAVIHNDYSQSDPQVAFFNDRLEITSHGGLPYGLSEREFYEGVSKPRNSHFMDVFLLLGLVEHTGHGIPTIIDKYGREAFEITNSYIRVKIPFNKEVLLNHGPLNEDIKGVNKEELIEKEAIILKNIQSDRKANTKKLSQTLNIPFRSLQRYIASLVSKGYLKRVGSRKTGHYEVVSDIYW